ncbi:hypothetical protein [Sphingobium yanoikuyae]|uniref:hypothetical protein n=1 Tax=Sphingobium yanoikuyae TaxID=13690 RepID=UPI0026E9677A|nr:hypothetical protein [Sphingobium yanoikuyae]
MMAMRRLTLLSVTMLAGPLGLVGHAQAEELLPIPIITQVATDGGTASGPADPAVPIATTEPAPEPPPEREKYPLLPIGGRAAIERGYHIQRALGASGMLIHNIQNMDSRNLAIAIAKGEDPPAGGHCWKCRSSRRRKWKATAATPNSRRMSGCSPSSTCSPGSAR